MDLRQMTDTELEDAIIDKYGVGDKNAYKELPVQFVLLCEENEEDPLVIEYYRRTETAVSEEEAKEYNDSTLNSKDTFLNKSRVCQ